MEKAQLAVPDTPDTRNAQDKTWLIFAEDGEQSIGQSIAAHLNDLGAAAIVVTHGDEFNKAGTHSYVLNQTRQQILTSCFLSWATLN